MTRASVAARSRSRGSDRVGHALKRAFKIASPRPSPPPQGSHCAGTARDHPRRAGPRRHDVDGQRELKHHVADDQQLLMVLLAELGHGRPHAREQLRDHGTDPMKKPGGKSPSRIVCQHGVGMHLPGSRFGRLFVGCHQHIAARRAQLLAVAFPGAWTSVEVLVWQELQGLTKMLATMASARLRSSLRPAWSQHRTCPSGRSQLRRHAA